MAQHHAFGRLSMARMSGVDLMLRELAHVVIKHVPFDLTVPSMGGFRTAEEQYRLYVKGVSRADGSPGSMSKHQTGEAIDLVPYVDGKAVWDEHLCTTLAAYMFFYAQEMDIRIYWGGFFNWARDCAHFELR